MNSSSVTPPQRIRWEAYVECLFFFTTYLIVRAFFARRHSVDRGVDVHDQGDDQRPRG